MCVLQPYTKNSKLKNLTKSEASEEIDQLNIELKKIVTLEKLGYRLRFTFVENRRIGFLFEKKEAVA